MSMCRVVSCVVGRACLLWCVLSLGKTLLAFALLHFLFQGQTCLLLLVSLDFLLSHSSPLWWKGHHFFGVSSRRSYMYSLYVYMFLTQQSEKAMAPHSSTLVWKIPWREERSGWGTRVYLWQIHVDMWQSQYNIVKFKKKKLNKKKQTKKKRYLE